MFKEKDNMRPGPTPERVLAICRLVEKGNYTSQDLFRLTELNPNSKNDEESIRKSIEAAEELGLVIKKNSKYVLGIPKEALDSSQTFRKTICPIIFSKHDSTFFKLTEWFISNADITQGINSFKDFSAISAKGGVESVTENDVLGWRFWIRYLGHAYQFNKTLIPNMKIRLGDALETVPKGKKMTCIQFLSWLKSNVPEAAVSCTRSGLPLAVSNGLRTLHEEGVIELISTKDAVKIGLYPLTGWSLNDFSEIVIKECKP